MRRWLKIRNFGAEMAKKRKGLTFIEIYGQKKAREIGRKISQKIILRQQGKTWEELWGRETALRIKNNLREKKLGISPMQGKKHSLSTKRLFSLQRQGNKNPSWLGGKAQEGYIWNWRLISQKIRERDNFTCQLCGDQILKQSKKRFLTAHHIDYNKNNNNSHNLISLCNFCNSSVNTQRNEWQNIFNKKMEIIQ